MKLDAKNPAVLVFDGFDHSIWSRRGDREPVSDRRNGLKVACVYRYLVYTQQVVKLRG